MPTLRNVAETLAASAFIGVPALAAIVFMLVPDAEIIAGLRALLQ